MARVDPRRPVGALVTEHPARARVLECFGIAYGTHGDQPLDEAAAEVGVRLDVVLDALDADDGGHPDDHPDWTTLGLATLADHVEQEHHARLRAELPRLEGLFEKVQATYGARHPEVPVAHETFRRLRSDLDQHLGHEEQVVFPLLRQLDEGQEAPSLTDELARLRSDHDSQAELLGRLHATMRGFYPPDDVGLSYEELCDGLAALEADVHLHLHKETNVLFPAAERRLAELCDHPGG